MVFAYRISEDYVKSLPSIPHSPVTGLASPQGYTAMGTAACGLDPLANIRNMKLLPFIQVEYRTRLSVEEIQSILQAHTEPGIPLSIFIPYSIKRYVGKIEGQEFKIARRSEHRNSFFPIISGEIEDAGSIRKVQVKMRLHLFTFGLFIIAVIFFLCASIYLIISQINSDEFKPASLFMMLLYSFGYLFSMLAFLYESNKDERFLKQMLKMKNIG